LRVILKQVQDDEDGAWCFYPSANPTN
jgi:hypothetical protein